MSDFAQQQTSVEALEAELRTGSIDQFPRDIGIDFFDLFEATPVGNERPTLDVAAPWRLRANRSSNITVVSSADFTILDTGPDVNLVTTGVPGRTITLPTVADNTGRIILVMKVDVGAGSVTVDGEGAETINGAATTVLAAQYNFVWVLANGTEWFIVG